MILKALYDYYHRSGDDVAPFGLEYKEIGFIIVIDRYGKFLRFEDRRIDKKSGSIPCCCQRWVFLALSTLYRLGEIVTAAMNGMPL